ncbi:MAG: OmpA family protein [Azospirillaceae bacterium]|nr:OmpA family protein [Azospirillaceae bacterium]
MLWSIDGLRTARGVVKGCAALLVTAGLAGCVPPPAPPAAAEPPIMAPAPTMPDRIIELTVNFDLNRHTIRPESYPLLDNLARALQDRRLAGYHFDINGHTDVTGRLGYNIALSTLRAAAVEEYLVARGVPRESMRIQGFGPLALLNPANPAGAENRRVEIVSVR